MRTERVGMSIIAMGLAAQTCVQICSLIGADAIAAPPSCSSTEKITPLKDCSYLRLDCKGGSLEKIPVLNQGDLRLCYAYAGTQIVQALIAKQTGKVASLSPVESAFNASLRSDRKDRSVRGGYQDEVVQSLLARGFACRAEKDLEKSFEKFGLKLERDLPNLIEGLELLRKASDLDSRGIRTLNELFAYERMIRKADLLFKAAPSEPQSEGEGPWDDSRSSGVQSSIFLPPVDLTEEPDQEVDDVWDHELVREGVIMKRTPLDFKDRFNAGIERVQCELNRMNADGLAANAYQVALKAYSSDHGMQVLRDVIYQACSQAENQVLIPRAEDWETDYLSKSSHSGAELIASINASLRKKTDLPIGIGVCSNVLTLNRGEFTECERSYRGTVINGHDVLVTGRRTSWVKDESGHRKRVCQYLVRNSWGEDCSKYGQGLDCEAKQGAVWIDQKDLESALIDVSITRKK